MEFRGELPLEQNKIGTSSSTKRSPTASLGAKPQESERTKSNFFTQGFDAASGLNHAVVFERTVNRFLQSQSLRYLQT